MILERHVIDVIIFRACGAFNFNQIPFARNFTFAQNINSGMAAVSCNYCRCFKDDLIALVD
jgi:hypothetical protein